jgi:hypothetical protein
MAAPFASTRPASAAPVEAAEDSEVDVAVEDTEVAVVVVGILAVCS